MSDFNEEKAAELFFELQDADWDVDSTNSNGLSQKILLLLNNSHIRHQYITDETLHMALDQSQNTLIELPVGYYDKNSFTESVNQRLDGKYLVMGSSCLYGCNVEAPVYLSMGMAIDSKFVGGGYFESCTLHDSACMDDVNTNNLIINDSVLHWCTLENGGSLSNCSLINCNTEDVLLFAGSVIQRGHNQKTRFAESGISVVGGKEAHSTPNDLLDKLNLFPVGFIVDNWERKGYSLNTFLRISPDTLYLPIINHFSKDGLDISSSYLENEGDDVQYGKMSRYLQTSNSENARLLNAIYGKANSNTLFKLNGAYFPSVYQHKNKMISVANKDASGADEVLAPSTTIASNGVKRARAKYLSAAEKLNEFKALSSQNYDSLESYASGQEALFTDLDEDIINDVGEHLNKLRMNFVESVKKDAKNHVVNDGNVSNSEEEHAIQMDLFGDMSIESECESAKKSVFELNNAIKDHELIADGVLVVDGANVGKEPSFLNSQVEFDNIINLLDGLGEVRDNLVVLDCSKGASIGGPGA